MLLTIVINIIYIEFGLCAPSGVSIKIKNTFQQVKNLKKGIKILHTKLDNIHSVVESNNTLGIHICHQRSNYSSPITTMDLDRSRLKSDNSFNPNSAPLSKSFEMNIHIT